MGEARRLRPGVARAAAVLLGLAAALLVGEGVARLVRGPALAVVVRAGFERADGSGAMAVLVPDGRLYGARPGHVEELIRIDSLGTRGPERAPVAPPDVRRLVVLGDSVAFGGSLPEDQTMPALLEVGLGAGWQVWNLAFPGYNTHQEAAALEHFGPTLQPDHVLVVWVINDAASLEMPRGGAPDGPALYVQRQVHLLPGLDPQRQVALWNRSALFRVVGDAWAGATGSEEAILLEEREHRVAIRRIGEQARALGADVTWASFPPLLDYPGWQEPARPGRPAVPWVRDPAWIASRDEAQAQCFEVVDLTAAFAGHRPSEVRLDDLHPNAKGNRIAAEYLVPRIGRRVQP